MADELLEVEHGPEPDQQAKGALGERSITESGDASSFAAEQRFEHDVAPQNVERFESCADRLTNSCSRDRQPSRGELGGGQILVDRRFDRPRRIDDGQFPPPPNGRANPCATRPVRASRGAWCEPAPRRPAQRSKPPAVIVMPGRSDVRLKIAKRQRNDLVLGAGRTTQIVEIPACRRTKQGNQHAAAIPFELFRIRPPGDANRSSSRVSRRTTCATPAAMCGRIDKSGPWRD